ncbi:MAG: TenA family protein [Muribaculaceae bacterium]|nr:TenA family protein [Muribaculaceae bacterium]
MENKWSLEAWNAAEPIYKAILDLPFIKELTAGTLSRERFEFYIGQDGLYLNAYSRVLAHIASRLPESGMTEDFLRFAGDGVKMEKILHAQFVSEAPGVMSPACLLYTSLLRAQASDCVAVETAAILPCFWIYLEVGKRILSEAELQGHPYAEWIRAYSDEAFERSNERAIEICDTLAGQSSDVVRARMTDIFVQAARMEWLFWQSAYDMQQWPEPIRPQL